MTHSAFSSNAARNEVDHPTLFISEVVSNEMVWEVGVVDSKWMAEQYPHTFQRPPLEEGEGIMGGFPVGMYMKVYCHWPDSALPSERFWIEVTGAEKSETGRYYYSGALRNDTLVAGYGARIGPLVSECFCDIDFERFFQERGIEVSTEQSE